jgi:hypothetical protein
MTPAQLATLKAHIAANQDPAVISAAATGNDTELARLYNLPSTFYVWRSTTPADEIADAILWDRLTPVDTPDGSAIQTNRLLLCQVKQMNLQVLLQGRDTIGTGRLNLRNGLSDALQNVPSAAGGAPQDAGWAGAGRVKAVINRLATVAERAFATGTGTTAVPGNLGSFAGSLTIQDIGDIRNYNP